MTNEKSYENFEKAESWLKLQGHSTINPMKVAEVLLDKMTEQQRIEIIFTYIRICDCIFMVDGWQKCEFAHKELDYAKMINKEIMYQRHFKEFKKRKKEQQQNVYYETTTLQLD